MKKAALALAMCLALGSAAHAETWWEKRGCIPYDDGGAQGLVFCPMMIDPDTKEILSREWIGPKEQTGGTMIWLRDRRRVGAVEAREQAREPQPYTFRQFQSDIEWQRRMLGQ